VCVPVLCVRVDCWVVAWFFCISDECIEAICGRAREIERGKVADALCVQKRPTKTFFVRVCACVVRAC
jgi:hypothetical protein